YFTRDHLGNTRVVTDGNGTVVERNDYYPFGERHSDSSMPTTNTNRWRFAGKEIQPLGSTGWLDFGARQYDSFLGRWTTVDPLAEKYPGISPYSYCAGNPIMFIDDGGKDLVIFGKNNSSVTFTTNLIDLSVNVGGIGIDWNGNHTIEGKDALSAALDLAGFIDPTGVADGANALLLASEGDTWGALLSSVALLPFGDIVKIGKVGKDVGIITDAIGVASHKHHIIPKAVYRDNYDILSGLLKRDGAENILSVPSGFHGNHPAYNKWIQNEISNILKTKPSLNENDVEMLINKAKAMIDKAQESVQKGNTRNMNSFFKEKVN
ncbi:MAG: hypothetical protein KBT05_05990, partial [Bacteroidales bacterium]|nr:hypothetical protein [Candidatus Cryptobacteroides caccocaballi]